MKTFTASRSRLALASFATSCALAAGGPSIAQTAAPSSGDQLTPQAPAATTQNRHPGAHSAAMGHEHHPHARGDHHHRRHGADQHRGDVMGRGLLRGLDLSQAQRDAIFAIMHAQAPVTRQQARQAREARQNLQQLALAGELDESRLREAAQRASQAMAELAVLRTRARHDVFKVLTPEQQAQVRTRLAQGRDGAHRHGSHHHGSRHG